MVSYSFLVNDSAFSNVILQQGIRRGEPALPYIVILYGELLSVLYCQAQESGLMTSIKLTRHFMAHLNTTRLSVSSHSTRKYCKNAHFRSVNCSPSASHGWRGLLLGPDLLVSRLRNAIGNGISTNLWKEAWISTKSQLRPFGPCREQNQDMIVADLLTHDSSCWIKKKNGGGIYSGHHHSNHAYYPKSNGI